MYSWHWRCTPDPIHRFLERGFTLEKETFWIAQNQRYYDFSATIFVKFFCPVRSGRLAIVDLTNTPASIIAETKFPNAEQTTLIASVPISFGNRYVFVLLDIPNICAIEQFGIVGESNFSEERAELKHVTDFDLALKIAYIPSRPVTLPTPPFPPQYPSPDTTYPWTSPVIPAGVIQGPTPPGLPNNDGYNKFQSVQYSIGFYLGLDMFTISPADPNLSVFLTNLSNRGIDNYRKKVYMTALTTDILGNYADKIDVFLNETVANFTTYSRPVLSSFKTSLINFFLAIHVGYDQYPEYVFKYFELFVDIIGFGDPNRAGRDEAMLYGHNTVPAVREYFAKRNEIIKQTSDKTTLLYYWHQAGLDPEGLVMEAIHNIIAFSQFNNTLFLLIRDKVQGTPNPLPPSLVLPPPFEYVKGPAIKYDFFTRMKAAFTDAARIDVCREAYRLLVPNNTSFSRVVQANPNPNVTIQGRHLHQLLMINNEANIVLPSQPYPPNTVIPGQVAYFIYNTQRYAAFQADFTTNVCPVPSPPPPTANYNPADGFIISNIDNETVLQKCNPKMIPVYPKPTYASFGLGYRRCPGEMFNYFITIKMIQKYAGLNFYFVESPPPGTQLVTLAPFFAAPDNIYARSP